MSVPILIGYMIHNLEHKKREEGEGEITYIVNRDDEYFLHY